MKKNHLQRNLHNERTIELDGLYLDVIPRSKVQFIDKMESAPTLENYNWGPPQEYFEFGTTAHREFVIFFHDEPESLPPHGVLAKDPCEEHEDGHGHGDFLPIMPVSYRAEPMINRERRLWAMGPMTDRPVLNEEQHHSSWMFGDPVTPILKAYIGDPVRIRFVHAAVKETHVFHLHLYEWLAVPQDRKSPRIDAISVSPQTAHTIEPVWGAGNRHQVAGDVIWHCHLYPHFHEGMWGIFRTFETLQEGPTEKALEFPDEEKIYYQGRKIGRYPDGTPIEKLLPLPDDNRKAPPRATPKFPGYPLYIPGRIEQKSPIPPWPDRKYKEATRDEEAEEQFCEFATLLAEDMPEEYNYRNKPTSLERNAFNPRPLPGELFTRNPFRPQQARQWEDPLFKYNGKKEECHEVIMETMAFEYNHHNWVDRYGHLYYLKADSDPSKRPKEPLFFRAQHGQILNLDFLNKSPLEIVETEFDPAFPPCEHRKWEAECAMHVHMVKFDPICGDGAATGWNYISGPIADKKMIYRWWLDQEFGTIFFHDHLFANYRQKHGLFGALIVEPAGAEFRHPITNKRICSGLQAKIKLPSNATLDKYASQDAAATSAVWFREFCIGIGDFIPMWKRVRKEGEVSQGEDPFGYVPLNPPEHPGGHGDQGVMGLNYRNEPIHERLKRDPNDHEFIDPALWFTSTPPYKRPSTTLFRTYENDPIWFRVVQGSHEEQHSFQIHGMRWLRFRVNPASPLRNQQTFGISEAFTFINHEEYKSGDYLYKLSGADDLWLGCWGLIRAFAKSVKIDEAEGLQPLEVETLIEEERESALVDEPEADGNELSEIGSGEKFRHFTITAVRKKVVYREPDLVDPFGLVYILESIVDQDGKTYPVPTVEAQGMEPLILRCREDEWVKVTLKNGLPRDIKLRPEPFAPQVPVEERNAFSHRPERPVSSQVSIHADLVAFDVKQSDGASVGRNRKQTVKPGEEKTYAWDPRRPIQQTINEPLGPVLLQDMADFRNHRHHGLIGALIIEHADATPFLVPEGQATADAKAEEAWYGSRVTLLCTHPPKENRKRVEEIILMMQDGLRLYLNGNIYMPISDEPPAHGDDDVDHEDQGQKGFNYRSEPVGPLTDPSYNPSGVNPPNDWLANPNPATPVFNVPVKSFVRLHLLGAQDKPRNQSFTIHGVSWEEWRFLSDKSPMVSSESAITTGTSRTFEFSPQFEGDYAYRSGILKWAVPQGLWGIIRVLP